MHPESNTSTQLECDERQEKRGEGPRLAACRDREAVFLRLLLIISASYSFWGVSFEFNHPILHTNNQKNNNNLKIKLSMFLLEAGEKRGEQNRLVKGP